MTILSDFGLRQVEPRNPVKHGCFSERTQQADLETINNDRAIGIEVEVENHSLLAEPNEHLWVRVGDGSLRNNGEEWITHPIKAQFAPAALYELFQVSLDQCCSFGPRTSVHVHINAQDMEPNQIKALTMLYCVFENVLFNFVGKNRNKNIFCVPISETGLMRELKRRSIANTVDSWAKYTGFNLQPLSSKGTVEFRHMHGSSDHVKLSQWVRIILRMFDYVTSKRFSEKQFETLCLEMDRNFDFHSLMTEVFGEDAGLLRLNGWTDVKGSVSAMHQAFVNNNLITPIVNTRVVESPFYTFFKASN